MAVQTPLSRSPEQPKRSQAGPNVMNVVLGNLLIKPWYPSFYPEELVGRKAERLYVCQWCFRYSKELLPFLSHMRVCAQQHVAPPGALIYSKDDLSIYEVDGEELKLYTQNLSLFAKLFLDTKSVFYDVTTFRYYLLTLRTPADGQQQVVGFFSKEKMSWDNNNVACILVFPPWQRRGLGQVLMGVSYELSRQEGRLGGPEKPLSSLGRKAYLAYWSASICRSVLSFDDDQMTVRAMVQQTWIAPEDVLAALTEMNVLEKGDGGAVISRARMKSWADENRVPSEGPIQADAFLEASNGRNGVHELEP